MAGKFLTELMVCQVNDKMWELVSPLVYQSDIVGAVTVPKGFQTDFCSVPRLPLAFMVDGNCGQRGGVVHDYLYSDPKVSRAAADAVLKEALEACGVVQAVEHVFWRANWRVGLQNMPLVPMLPLKGHKPCNQLPTGAWFGYLIICMAAIPAATLLTTIITLARRHYGF